VYIVYPDFVRFITSSGAVDVIKKQVSRKSIQQIFLQLSRSWV